MGGRTGDRGRRGREGGGGTRGKRRRQSEGGKRWAHCKNIPFLFSVSDCGSFPPPMRCASALFALKHLTLTQSLKCSAEVNPASLVRTNWKNINFSPSLSPQHLYKRKSRVGSSSVALRFATFVCISKIGRNILMPYIHYNSICFTYLNESSRLSRVYKLNI